MRRSFFTGVLALATTGLVLACAASGGAKDSAAPAAPADPHTAGMTSQQLALYQKCLDDHRIVAMSWEAIQENCRREVMDDDPLKLKSPSS